MICLAGWVNRNQQDVIEYLQEEVRVLREQLGKKPNFNDDKRRRLAAKAKKIRRRHLKGIATLATPRTLLDWQQRLIARKYNGNSSAQRVDLPPRGKCASFILTKDGRREPYLGLYSHQGRAPEPGP